MTHTELETELVKAHYAPLLPCDICGEKILTKGICDKPECKEKLKCHSPY